MSDREQTLNALPPEVGERREKLGAMFGKLKVTYFKSSYTTEMDGFTDTIRYTVLGTDDNSVVIRDDSPPDPELADFGLSRFTQIHFEGDDVYWLTTEIGGFREYFKRVTKTQP
jgi:hypothetical protein